MIGGVADQRDRRANAIICRCAVPFVWWMVAAQTNMTAFRHAMAGFGFSERQTPRAEGAGFLQDEGQRYETSSLHPKAVPRLLFLFTAALV